MKKAVADDKTKKIVQMSQELIELTRDILTVRFRFFDVPSSMMKYIPAVNSNGCTISDYTVKYDPEYLLKRYLQDGGYATRLYLHGLLHMVFMHQFNASKLDKRYWNLAADIAVENVIIELDIPEAGTEDEVKKIHLIDSLKKRNIGFTADKLYKFFMREAETELLHQCEKAFFMDNHDWYGQENNDLNKKIYEKTAARVRTELEAFSGKSNSSLYFYENIKNITKQKHNLKDVLKTFFIQREEMSVSDEEFDYIYYTYGLSNYQNMPLIEPLEYKEVKKISDFVIAIDTSASCSKAVVKSFLEKTYGIIQDTESFFSKINVHIIQCDEKVRNDTRITCIKELKEFMEKGRLIGFGGTDFRPVFEYVDRLVKKGEFENLKGVIYFTDGYGTYPERMPEYQVVFAFLNEDMNREKVPVWAMEVVLEEELNEH